MARVLIVEDNADLAAGIQYNLSLEGYDTCIAEDGRRALTVAEQWSPDVILLDLMLPELDGYQVLQTLRARGVKTPVVILTAKSEEADKVRGFRLDADQYVTKPFGVLELLERVRALIRRSARDSAGSAPPPLRFGDVVVDTSSRMVTRAGVPCALTPKAYELLLALIRRAGAVATRNELLKEVWGYSAFVTTRTVDSHVAELRRKIEADPASPKYVKTVWKVGYRFEK
ncbi:MAG TPA: response regulator transcription factor [Gemmatimonadaceae bacterium]|jgi:DNA-binding response OmpR family regulator|nr:response regulator transcription factor [Gemmatimonadaceae bacterium]